MSSDQRKVLTVNETVDVLKNMDDILIFTHRRPDGDTVGSASALCVALRSIGKNAYVFQNDDNVPRLMPYLQGLFPPENFKPAHYVSVDIATRWLFPSNGMEYPDMVELVIDHHPSNDGFGDMVCADPKCAACGELMYEIIMRLCGGITAQIAERLYVAVSTDTGCFRYSNTTANTHIVAAKLMETGIDSASVNKIMFSTKSMARLKLEAALVNRAKLFDDGKIVITTFTNEMADKLNVTPDDEDDIAGIVRTLEGVSVAVTIRENEEGFSKVSVRTSRGISATKICMLLGGGGHENAGGCTIQCPPDEAEKIMLEAIRTVINNG